MTTPSDRISVPAALLWAILVTLIGAISGGSFWLGGLSQRVSAVEKQVDTDKTLQVDISKIQTDLATIKAQMKFLLSRNFPNQQGEQSNGQSIPDLGLNR